MSGFLKKFFVNKTCAYIHYDELRDDKVVNQTRKFPDPEKAKEWVRTELVNRKIYNVRFVVAQKLDIKAIDPISGEVF
jgi:ribosomal protein S30